MAEVSEIEAGGEIRTIKDPTARKSMVYSINETDTGMTWVNGKRIYKRTWIGRLTGELTIVPENTLNWDFVKVESASITNWSGIPGNSIGSIADIMSATSAGTNYPFIKQNPNTGYLSILFNGGGSGATVPTSVKINLTLYYTKD